MEAVPEGTRGLGRGLQPAGIPEGFKLEEKEEGEEVSG